MEHLAFNGEIAQIVKNTRFTNPIKKYETRYHVSIPRILNEKPTEGAICEIKKRWYNIILNNMVPNIIWDYGLV